MRHVPRAGTETRGTFLFIFLWFVVCSWDGVVIFLPKTDWNLLNKWGAFVHLGFTSQNRQGWNLAGFLFQSMWEGGWKGSLRKQ